jgi:hypothetical protein
VCERESVRLCERDKERAVVFVCVCACDFRERSLRLWCAWVNARAHMACVCEGECRVYLVFTPRWVKIHANQHIMCLSV